MVNVKSSASSPKLCTLSQLVTFIVMTITIVVLSLKISMQQSYIHKLQVNADNAMILPGLPVIIKKEIKSNDNTIKKSDQPSQTMKQIGLITGTDKTTFHGYDRYYPMFLESHRSHSNYTMLEIGYLLGQSYQMWLQYFPLANIYFMDKDCAKTYKTARYCGDQGKVKDLQQMLSVKQIENKLDLIIDDGSHHPVHQITSFKYLFEHGLKTGGIYIIEDIEMNYWQKGETYGLTTKYGKDHPESLITHLKTLVDVVNREFSPPNKPYSSPFGTYIDAWVGSIFFGHNCVVITKMSVSEKETYGVRKYHCDGHFE